MNTQQTQETDDEEIWTYQSPDQREAHNMRQLNSKEDTSSPAISNNTKICNYSPIKEQYYSRNQWNRSDHLESQISVKIFKNYKEDKEIEQKDNLQPLKSHRESKHSGSEILKSKQLARTTNLRNFFRR